MGALTMPRWRVITSVRKVNTLGTVEPADEKGRHRRRREAVQHHAGGAGLTRACSVLGVDRTSMRYRGSRPSDAAIRVRPRELAAIRRRCGYRRLHFFLTQEGFAINHKKLRRIYAKSGCGAPARRLQARDRNAGADDDPERANQRWSLDFASDALTDGRRLRILIVVDDFTRECLALVADTSLGGVRHG